MELSSAYMQRAELAMLLTTLIYFLMNGAQIFETLVLVPKWVADPPRSFQLLADKNGTSLKTFWIVFHSIHEVSFLLAIALTWQIKSVSIPMLVLFILHFAVRVWTLAYFAPNIIRFQKLYEGGGNEDGLKARAMRWQQLNYLRVMLFVAISLGVAWLYLAV